MEDLIDFSDPKPAKTENFNGDDLICFGEEQKQEYRNPHNLLDISDDEAEALDASFEKASPYGPIEPG